MDIVDIGDENGIITSKVKGITHHLTVSDNLEYFLKIPSCRLVLLGVDNPDAYSDCLIASTTRDAPSCQVCLIDSPNLLENDGLPSQCGPLSPYGQASLQGIFAKGSTIAQKPLYVDVVHNHGPSPEVKNNSEPSVFPILGPTARKASNASSVSTQADDVFIVEDDEHVELYRFHGNSRSYGDVDGSVVSDWETSELSYTTKERRMRMESRRKVAEIKSKKESDTGLLAVVSCPCGEPDRSISSLPCLICRVIELYP
jgi:hypothetical protein